MSNKIQPRLITTLLEILINCYKKDDEILVFKVVDRLVNYKLISKQEYKILREYLLDNLHDKSISKEQKINHLKKLISINQ